MKVALIQAEKMLTTLAVKDFLKNCADNGIDVTLINPEAIRNFMVAIVEACKEDARHKEKQGYMVSYYEKEVTDE